MAPLFLNGDVMKWFWISLLHGVTDLGTPVSDLEVFEAWMQEALSHITQRLSGNGQVHVKPVDDLRAEVTTTFVVEGLSVLDISDRFRNDLEALQAITRGLEITETGAFKFCFPMVAGQRLGGTFMRVNPDTGDPMNTEE